MKSAELLIFDLDGTLIDSKLDLVNSVNATRAWMSLEPLSVERISSYVGNGAPNLIKRALPDATDPQLEEALNYFFAYYKEHMLDATVLYPGVREALDELHAANKAMAILTNKAVRFSQTLIQRLNLDAHFFRIYGGNSFPEKKPHPIGLQTLMQERNVAPERTVMIGDSAIDIQTARAAGTKAIGVDWGFQPETLVTTPPDLLISDLRELSALVR
ncbi:MAG: HAD-IA family hydrolase [Bryobacteraceae bacterium]